MSEMKIPIAEKKQEAIRRLKELHVIGDAIKQFRLDDKVMVSEPPLGALYWLREDQKKVVADFEREYNALVYLVVRSYTSFGKMDALLYVSDYREEWAQDVKDIKDGYVFAYVYNYDEPHFSEFGTVGVSQRFGGLIRTA